MPQTPEKQPSYRSVFLVAMVAVILFGALSILRVPRSGSLDHRVFVLTFHKNDIHKGNYVEFDITSHFINNGKPTSILKRVACDEGDSLTTEGRDYYCNFGDYLGRAKEFSLKGDPVENFVYTGRIPKGYMFVTGSSKDSFDSRYFGFVRKADVKNTASAIF